MTQDVSDLDRACARWLDDGFAIVPGLLTADDLAPAVAALASEFPTADDFHDDVDPERNAPYRDEFGGIHPFPLQEVELSLLAVHPKVVAAAAHLLGRDPLDLRCYTAEGWAKFTGAADFDQPLHRDYLNHTMLVPSDDVRFSQVECFLYLVDVPEALGPPHFLSRRRTSHLPMLPNWYPADASDPDARGWTCPSASPDLYEHEESAAGPAGTVVLYRPSTFHRGTALSAPRGARYTIHTGFRPADVEWGQRMSWTAASTGERWHDFVARASWRQLALFGFPPPGHPFWTPQTLAGLAQRYPRLDVTPWTTG